MSAPLLTPAEIDGLMAGPIPAYRTANIDHAMKVGRAALRRHPKAQAR